MVRVINERCMSVTEIILKNKKIDLRGRLFYIIFYPGVFYIRCGYIFFKTMHLLLAGHSPFNFVISVLLQRIIISLFIFFLPVFFIKEDISIYSSLLLGLLQRRHYCVRNWLFL